MVAGARIDCGIGVADQSGDAKVQQACQPILADQDIVWLEIAVQDQILVGMLDSGTDLLQQAQAAGKIGLLSRAIIQQ